MFIIYLMILFVNGCERIDQNKYSEKLANLNYVFV